MRVPHGQLHRRALVADFVLTVALLIGSVFTAAAHAQDQASADDARQRLEHLRRDARQATLPLDARRRAAESLLEALDARAATHAGEPQAAIVLADAAEECFVTVLPLGGDLDAVLFSIPTHQEWRRVSATIAAMLDFSERAAAAASAAVARLSDPSIPLGAADLKALDQLEVVEIPRRIPLLRGLALALAAGVVDTTPESRRDRALNALEALRPLLGELEGEARFHAAYGAALAASRVGDDVALDLALAAARDDMAEPLLRRRLELVATEAIAFRGRTEESLERLHRAEANLRPEDGDDLRRRWAELEARIRRNSMALAGSEHWTTPLLALVREAPPGRRDVLRSAVIARLTDLAEGDPQGGHGVPILDLASAEALSRVEASLVEALTRAESALAGFPDADPWRAAALDTVARLRARLARWDGSAEAFLERADRFRAEASAADAASRGIVISRALDAACTSESRRHGDPNAKAARARLRRAVDIGASAFPDHPDRALWRLERVVLEAEDMEESGRGDGGSRDALAAAILAARPALASLEGHELEPRLRARLALATATIALSGRRPDDALAALDVAPSLSQVPDLADALRDRRLRTLALLDRDLLADPQISAARPSANAALAASLQIALEELAPAPEPGVAPQDDSRRRAAVLRLVALADALALPTPRGQLIIADALRTAGLPDAALERYDALLTESPDRADLLLAVAESLMELSPENGRDRERLARAMSIYQRLLAGREYAADEPSRDAVWWLCQLRQLECLHRAGAASDRIGARVERLRALDSALGGPRFHSRIDAFKSSAR